MRIAIDIRSLMEGRQSGVEEYTVQIISALLRVAPQHEYHAFYNAAQSVSLPAFAPALRLHRFRYPNTLLNAAQWSSGYPKWNRFVSADCYFVPSFRLLPLTSGTPVVTTVHDLSFERFPEFFSWRRRAWHSLMRPRQLMQDSTRLIAVSQATAQDLQALYKVPAHKVAVIHSGIADMRLPSAASVVEARRKYNLPEKYILYFGTLEPRKNIPAVIQAFTAIADQFPHHLVLAGARGWLTQPIDDALQHSLQRTRIHLPGFIDQNDKMALYAGASILVYPSFYEGFGFPPLESLLAGTPVITSRNSALPEIVGEWATLIDPYDVGELALVLRELLRAPARVPEEIQRAVQQRYTWEAAGRATIKTLEEAAA